MKQVILFLLILISLNLSAQFKITGEYRPRFEYRHGYKTLPDSGITAARFISQRTRINLSYQAEKIKTGFSLQDVRTWGNQSQQNISDGLVSVHEAWFEYTLLPKFSLKAGRQQLAYNDHRILGNSDWNQQGRSHDVLLFKLVDSLLNIHAGFGWNQNQELNSGTQYTISNNYKALQFLWLNRKFGSTEASVLFINNGIQSPVSANSIRYNQVSGLHIENTTDQWWWVLKAYYQSGRDGTTNNEMQGWMSGAEIMKKMKNGFSLSAGAELFSGQSQTETSANYYEKVHSFTPLYGTGHKFNGYMDYFYAGSSHENVGLTDLYIRVKYKNEKYFLAFEPHYFLSGNDVRDDKYYAGTSMVRAMDPYLGTELDFTLGWTPQKNVTFQGGYSQLFASSTLEAIKKGSKDESANWAYVMIIVRPEFIK